MNTTLERKKLLQFDYETACSILCRKNNVIVRSKEELKDLVLEAFENRNLNKKIHLGVIPLKVIKRIKNEITDISKERLSRLFKDDVNYALSIRQKEIRHLKKESLSVNDVVDFILTLSDLICNFDSVRFTIYNNEQNALRFKKKMKDGTHIALEVISNKYHTFRTHTLFLDKIDFKNKKRNLSPTFND